MLHRLSRFFFSENIFNIDVQVKSKIKKHFTKVHFRVVSKYKRFFQLKNRFLAVNLRTLFLRISRKWSFRDFFFFKKLSIYKFKFFTYKLAIILKQLLKYFYICNEKTFKRNILDKFINFSNRLDLVCIRVHFFKNILEARLGITRGFVRINGSIITYWNFYLKKYDFVTLHIPQEYALRKARKLIFYIKRVFRYRWRMPVFLRSLHQVFSFTNQIRLFICRVLFFCKFYFVVSSTNIYFFLFVYMRCFKILKYWIRFLRLFILSLPRAYILCLYYVRRFFKKKIINYIRIARERRQKFLKKKFYAGIKKFRGKRGFRGLVYYHQDSIKEAAAELPYKYKRVDKALRVKRYASFFSRFMLFFFLSCQFFFLRYRRKKFDILGRSFSFFFARIQFYKYLFLEVAYYIFLVVYNVIKMGACFVCFNYRTVVDSIMGMSIYLYSPKYRKKYIRIVKKIGSKRIVTFKKNIAFGTVSKFLLLFGRRVRYHFLFCYLYFIRLFKIYFNLYLYIRLYVKLCRRFRRYKHKLRYIYIKSKPSRRRRYRFFIKRRFRVYSSKFNYCSFGIKKTFSKIFFNLFLYYNCIDFDLVEIPYLHIKFRKYTKILFAKANLKYNYMHSLYYFLNLDSNYFSLFFLFFNMDNLFRFLFLYLTTRETAFIYSRCKNLRIRSRKFRHLYCHSVNHLRFRMFFEGYRYLGAPLILFYVSILLNRYNSYLLRLERVVFLSKFKFKRLFFFILSMLSYLLHTFGYFRNVRHMLAISSRKALGRGSFNRVYNKFFLLNWYNKNFKYFLYSKYRFSSLKLNRIYIYSQNLYLFNCFNFFKKLTSFFKKNFKFFNLYIYTFLHILNIQFNSCYRLHFFCYNMYLVLVSDSFYFFMISFCFRILNNIYDNALNINNIYNLFDVVFKDSYNINLFLFKFKFNLYFFLFKRLKRRFRVYLKRRYYLRLSPMFVSNTYVRQTLKRHFPIYWTTMYTFNTSAAYRGNKYNYLYMRQFLCNYILRYHFNLRIGRSDFIKYRYIRKTKTNFFFSKSFLYYDIEYNTTSYPGFMYIGDSNSYVRRLQMRFNFFMTLILRFYAHSRSLVRK